VTATSARDRVVAAALVVAALAATFPGFHLLELRLPRLTAMLISHGVGLVLLAAAVIRWRGRRP
jgi:hypothetical protein